MLSHKTFFSPPFASHGFFNCTPNLLHNLSVTPSSSRTSCGIPLVNCCTHDPSTPALHCTRRLLTPPSNVDAQGVPEKLWRVGPPVSLKLPYLTCGKYGNDTRPIFVLELIRCVNENKTLRAIWIDGR